MTDTASKTHSNSGWLLGTMLLAAYIISPILFVFWQWVVPTLDMGVTIFPEKYGSSHWLSVLSVAGAWHVVSNGIGKVKISPLKKMVLVILGSVILMQLCFFSLLMLDNRTWVTTDYQPFTSNTQENIVKNCILPWNTLFGNLGVLMQFQDNGTIHPNFDISNGLSNTLDVQFEQWFASLACMIIAGFFLYHMTRIITEPLTKIAYIGTKGMFKAAQSSWMNGIFLAYYLSKSGQPFIGFTHISASFEDFLKTLMILTIMCLFGSWTFLASMAWLSSLLVKSSDNI